MKLITLMILTLIANATSIASTIGSIYLAYHNIKGWGWFLFVAVITNTVPRLNNLEKKEKNEEPQLILE